MYVFIFLLNKQSEKAAIINIYGMVFLESACVQKDLYKFMIMQHFGKEWAGFLFFVFFNQILYIGKGKP